LGAHNRKDYKEAVRIFRLSVEQMDSVGQNNLGKLYGNGYGVLQDYVLAHMWLNLASSNGLEIAVKYRNIVEKKNVSITNIKSTRYGETLKTIIY
jgi:uncharacterized protein